METSTSKVISSQKQAATLRAVYTGIIFLGQFSMGLILSIGGSSMVDLRYLMGDVQAKASISTASISLQSAVQIAGAVLGGLLSFTYKMSLLTPYLNRQLFTSILLLLASVSFASTPHLHSVYLYCGLSCIVGIGIGNMSTISNTWLIEMWSGRLLAAILQTLQLSYGLGQIVGPLLIRSHLHGYMNATKVEEMNVEEYREEIDTRRHSLIGTFTIVGCILGLVGFLHLSLYLTGIFRYRKTTSPGKSASSELQTEEPSERKLFELPHNRRQLYLFMILIIFTFAANNLVDLGFNSFQETFYQSLPSVKVTASEAAGVASITATSYTVGRVVSIFLSTVLFSGNLLLLHFGLALTGFVSLLWSTRSSLTLIRLNAALIGYSLSAIMPSMFAFINTYSRLDDRRNAIFHLAQTIPSTFTQLLIGQFIEKSPSILIYLIIPAPVVSATAFALVRFWLVRQTEAKEKKARQLAI